MGQPFSIFYKDREYKRKRGEKYYRRFHKGKIIYLHRQKYEDYHGRVPPGFTIHHIHGVYINEVYNLIAVSEEDHKKLHKFSGSTHYKNAQIRFCIYCGSKFSVSKNSLLRRCQKHKCKQKWKEKKPGVKQYLGMNRGQDRRLKINFEKEEN